MVVDRRYHGRVSPHKIEPILKKCL
jgi:hypothetical protein